jgi:hypothetical protein
MQENERERLSQLRKSLTELLREIQDLAPILLARQPMLKGSVYRLERKCGKPTCACASGTPHGSMVLSWSEAGRTRLRSIPAQKLDQFRRLTQRYQRFRNARARLVQINKAMLDLVNQIEQLRRREP